MIIIGRDLAFQKDPQQTYEWLEHERSLSGYSRGWTYIMMENIFGSVVAKAFCWGAGTSDWGDSRDWTDDIDGSIEMANWGL